MKRLTFLAIVALLAVAGVYATGMSEAELGTEENPLVWSFVPSGDTQEIVAGGQEVADMIYERTGLFVEVSVATEYAGVIEALASEPPEAHIASLATFSYIRAADRGVAEAELVAVRFGNPYYNGQLIANVESGITEVADLDGATFARPDPLSTSGWIIPMITMRAAGIVPERDLDQIVDAGGHGGVVAAVYNGDVDAGATYVDARTTIEEDNPDVMEKVRVIETSVPIPNDGVQFHPDVPEELKTQIVDALLAISETEEGKEALGRAYSWDGLVGRGDEFYDPFRQVLQASGLDLEEIEAD